MDAQFEYLNRSARPMAARVREVLETWFTHYPMEHQASLGARLRSNEDSEHLSAVQELALHELHRRLDVALEIHVEVEGPKRPDLHTSCAHHGTGFLEAISTPVKSREEVTGRGRVKGLYDAIQRVDSPDFWLGVRIRGVPASAPPTRKLLKELKGWIARLDVEVISATLNKGGRLFAVPHWMWPGDGYRIDVFPTMRKSPKARKRRGDRSGGMIFEGGVLPETAAAIRRRLVKKSGRYGSLGEPYIVALNLMHEYFERIEMVEVLFGDEVIHVDQSSGLRRASLVHRPNGVWVGPSGPKWTRLSGVLVTERLTAWNLARTSAVVYHNPWAKRPYECELCQLSQVRLVDGRLVRTPGAPLGSLLGLDSDWPGSD